MNEMDPIRAKQVWQRVRGEPAAEGERREELAMELAALLQSLWARLGGTEAALCRRCREQTRRTAAVLRGIAAMEGRRVPPCRQSNLQGTAEALLRRSIQTAARLTRELEPMQQGDFARTGAILVARTSETQTQLLQLLGRMEKY